MQKKGWILFLILLCVAFLVSCKGKEDTEAERRTGKSGSP